MEKQTAKGRIHGRRQTEEDADAQTRTSNREGAPQHRHRVYRQALSGFLPRLLPVLTIILFLYLIEYEPLANHCQDIFTALFQSHLAEYTADRLD
jgi:hypothetical protein